MATIATKLITATFHRDSLGPGITYLAFIPQGVTAYNLSTGEELGGTQYAPVNQETGALGAWDAGRSATGQELWCNDDPNVPAGTWWEAHYCGFDGAPRRAPFAFTLSTADPDILLLSAVTPVGDSPSPSAIVDLTSTDVSVIITTPRAGVRNLQVVGGGGGGVGLGSATPLSDSGTGVVGTGTAASHEDHRHPLDSAYATAGALTTEATTRAAGDATNAAAVTSEASTRATADSTHAALTTTAHGGIVASTDARLSDARTPTTHHTTHNTGGSDAMAPADIGAATSAALTSHTGNTANPHAVTAAQLADLTEAVQDIIGAMVAAGSGITVTYNDAAGTLTIAATGGGGGSLTVKEVDGTPSVTATTLRFPNGTVTDDGGGQATVGDLARLDVTNTFTQAQTVQGTLTVGAGGSTGIVTADPGGGYLYLRSTGGNPTKINDDTSNPVAIGNVFPQAMLHIFSFDSGAVNAIKDTIISTHYDNSGTPTNGYGNGVLLQMESTTGDVRDAVRLAAVWDTATDASRIASLRLSTVQAAGALTERGRFDGSATANDTGFWLWDANSGTLKRVVVGAADSGGTGYRLLRIAN